MSDAVSYGLVTLIYNKWLPDEWFTEFVDDTVFYGKDEAEINLKINRASYIRAQKENIQRRKNSRMLKGMTGFKDVEEGSDGDSDDSSSSSIQFSDVDSDEATAPVSVAAPTDTAGLMSAMADAWSEEFPFADPDDF